MSKGVIYIANGKKYIEEAVQSARSLKNKMPGMNITLFSSEDVKSPYFNNVILIKNDKLCKECPHMAKQIYISRSPYEHTLFLDTDTYICDDISELFALLEKFDIAASHAALRVTHKDSLIPKSFPEFSSGAIVFRKSPEVKKIFSDWFSLYNQQRAGMNGKYIIQDQLTFREALYASNARIATLTPEYNCYFICPIYLEGPVKILHGRYPHMEYIAREINKKTKMRVFILGIGTLAFNDRHPLITLILQRFKYILKWRSRL
ncbi:MAG: hypothetical protein WBC74_03875 [Candidatus Omnitrophota bacterium]